ncbi:ATP-binding protein [Streptomyces fumanus]|uniref:ATP-binding protein n=1 Tax=Streptomyces fumanus TaxID=67302 RepID=UPI0033FC341F
MKSLKVHGANVETGMDVETLVSCVSCPSGCLWRYPFLAEARYVKALRATLRLQLESWGLHALVETVQLCVSELVANVIQHVGPGTPTTLVVSTDGARLRIEVHDPDLRALPTLTAAGLEAEAGRGMALIGALTARWGVDLNAQRKATWCELDMNVTSAGEQTAPVAGVLGPPRRTVTPQWSDGASKVQMAHEEEMVIGLVVDLLRRLHRHGWDPDEVLDQAQTRFEVSVDGCGA